MWTPKAWRSQKAHKGRSGGVAANRCTLGRGQYGLVALRAGRLEAPALEALRRAFNRRCKRGGQIWFCVFPQLPRTRKPAEVRMGKGKGAFDRWVAYVKAGQVLVEMEGLSLDGAKGVAEALGHRTAVPTRLVHRRRTLPCR
uniref:Ribosomal protein L16 n=1 Tax=Picocystis salinarum TaxID=88271 RepID=A0A4D6C4E5_9CHLO|nr:ribosomal protein L16 [Picocystis salinarum]QBX98534.1 ribosomal protein L16 [Picocystis salinarum]